MRAIATIAGAEIERLHALATTHADKAVDYAKQAGKLLLEVKQSLKHGEWLPWLEKAFQCRHGRPRTTWPQQMASRYWRARLPRVKNQMRNRFRICRARELVRWLFLNRKATYRILFALIGTATRVGTITFK